VDVLYLGKAGRQFAQPAFLKITNIEKLDRHEKGKEYHGNKSEP